MELLVAILGILDNCYKAMTAEEISSEVNAYYLLNEHYTLDQVQYALNMLEDKQLIYQTLPTAYRAIKIYVPEPRQPEAPKKKPSVIGSLVESFRSKVASL